MVDAGEDPDHTAQREFLEETMSSETLGPEELASLKEKVAGVFSKGKVVRYATSHQS